MATVNLTDISIKSRQVIRYSIYFVIAYFIFRFTFRVAYTAYKAATEGPPPPTVGFGQLAELTFPDTYSPEEIEYILETPSGGLPAFPIDMKVYLMPKFSTTLASVDTAREKANSLKYTIGPVALKPILYRFSNPEVPSSMTINIVTGEFSVSYNLAADPIPLQSNPPSPDEATSVARSLLKAADSLPEDLSGPVVHDYLKIEGQNLVKALAQADADLVRVNLFRSNMGVIEDEKNPENSFEGYPSLPPNPLEANTWLILSGSRDDNRVLIGAEHVYYPIDDTKVETYPIKTAQQAFAELQDGKGYIANFGLNSDGKVIIRRVFLAYYDPDAETQFYQPIVVFEGDNDFYAYVPAVTDEYYGGENSENEETTSPSETTDSN